ncbi:hypothetical protein FJY63_02195 [Candidatus Sumerlaeota bacterium]|nr:hypothetical protein [Candidatus Sumerlaeota bacterium]
MVDHQRVFDLTNWLDDVLRRSALRFDSLTPSSIPSEGGIYFISDFSQRNEEVIYVGLTGNLSQRIYTDQLHGDKINSSVKAALVDHGRAKNMAAAKDYLRKHCGVRYAVVPDYREREMREGFATAILKPPFSIYKSKEH